MSQLSIRCVRAAFLFLALGVGLGASFALDRSLGAQLRPLHVELNLWGWATLLIYGMGYHMLPRFSGRPLRWPRMAAAQTWLAIIGVALISAGWLVAQAGLPWGRALLLGGGVAQFCGAAMFALLAGNLLVTRSK